MVLNVTLRNVVIEADEAVIVVVVVVVVVVAAVVAGGGGGARTGCFLRAAFADTYVGLNS